MKIIYYADNGSMGKTSSGDCDRFRQWAREELEQEYPDAEIDVSSESHYGECDILWGESDPDYHAEEAIVDFCHRLWDRMTW